MADSQLADDLKDRIDIIFESEEFQTRFNELFDNVESYDREAFETMESTLETEFLDENETLPLASVESTLLKNSFDLISEKICTYYSRMN